MTNTSMSQENNEQLLEIADQIDLREVVGAFLRHWQLIVGGGSIGLLLSTIFIARSERIFQGEFQIVLSSGQDSNAVSLLAQNSALATISALGGGSRADSILTRRQGDSRYHSQILKR